MGGHVFVCYASEDLDFVLKLAATLKAQGVPVWLDRWDIPHGANWNRTRDNALYDAAQCLVVLSPAAVDSEQVEAEWVTGLEEKKHIVPILYQACRIPSRLRLLQRFDFTNSRLEDEAALEVLVRVLGGKRQAVDSSSIFQQKADINPAVMPEAPPETNPSLASSPSTFSNSIGMEFLLIPAGEFRMGAEDGADDEKPVHRVRITRPFYLAKYPTTQAQWEAVMGNNPSRFKGDPNSPVENVSWDDVQDFLRQLSEKEGRTYRLLTEAEWEYAARAGTTTTYSFGDDVNRLREYGWYTENSGGRTRSVGQLEANAWGLHDMHGNVWEWVQDWYAAENHYQQSGIIDPKGPEEGVLRVVRGGSWYDAAGALRVSRRIWYVPSRRLVTVGFRCAV